jgi:outer membrane immunogenic protein
VEGGKMTIVQKRVKRQMTGVAIACLALVAASTTMAADLPYRKAPPAAPPIPVFTWTGFYLGASAGALFHDNTWTTTNLTGLGIPPDATAGTKFDSIGARFGLYGGYNWQFAPNFVTGIEADIAGDVNAKKSFAGFPGTLTFLPALPSDDSVSSKPNFDGSVRGRLGYLIFPTTMLYGTSFGANCPGTANSYCTFAEAENYTNTMVGWTAGAGIETVLGGNWLVRAEYRYSDFGSSGHTFFANSGNNGVDAITVKTKVDTQVATFGIAYKF